MAPLLLNLKIRINLKMGGYANEKDTTFGTHKQ